ncbi:hypothetical protein D3C79_429060 [compost metagenome]
MHLLEYETGVPAGVTKVDPPIGEDDFMHRTGVGAAAFIAEMLYFILCQPVTVEIRTFILW